MFLREGGGSFKDNIIQSKQDNLLLSKLTSNEGRSPIICKLQNESYFYHEDKTYLGSKASSDTILFLSSMLNPVGLNICIDVDFVPRADCQSSSFVVIQ